MEEEKKDRKVRVISFRLSEREYERHLSMAKLCYENGLTKGPDIVSYIRLSIECLWQYINNNSQARVEPSAEEKKEEGKNRQQQPQKKQEGGVEQQQQDVVDYHPMTASSSPSRAAATAAATTNTAAMGGEQRSRESIARTPTAPQEPSTQQKQRVPQTEQTPVRQEELRQAEEKRVEFDRGTRKSPISDLERGLSDLSRSVEAYKIRITRVDSVAYALAAIANKAGSWLLDWRIKRECQKKLEQQGDKIQKAFESGKGVLFVLGVEESSIKLEFYTGNKFFHSFYVIPAKSDEEGRSIFYQNAFYEHTRGYPYQLFRHFTFVPPPK
jgi:hypothetical protein